eukprot:tig00001021_g6302.t1
MGCACSSGLRRLHRPGVAYRASVINPVVDKADAPSLNGRALLGSAEKAAIEEAVKDLGVLTQSSSATPKTATSAADPHKSERATCSRRSTERRASSKRPSIQELHKALPTFVRSEEDLHEVLYGSNEEADSSSEAVGPGQVIHLPRIVSMQTGAVSTAIPSGTIMSSSVFSGMISPAVTPGREPRRASVQSVSRMPPRSRCSSARVLSNSNLLDASKFILPPASGLRIPSLGPSRRVSLTTAREREEERDTFNAEEWPLPPPLDADESESPRPAPPRRISFGISRRCSLPALTPYNGADSDEGSTGRTTGPPVRRGRADLALGAWKHGVLHEPDLHPADLIAEMEELSDISLLDWDDEMVSSNLGRLRFRDVVPPLEMERVLNPRPLARPDLTKLRRYSGASSSLHSRKFVQMRASREELADIPIFRDRAASLPDHLFSAPPGDEPPSPEPAGGDQVDALGDS